MSLYKIKWSSAHIDADVVTLNLGEFNFSFSVSSPSAFPPIKDSGPNPVHPARVRIVFAVSRILRLHLQTV